MKKILSTVYSDTSFNLGMLILRAALGFMMIINHGLEKISNFSQMSATFFDPFHIGRKASLTLVIFAELFCSMFVILGLFTRIAAFILFINMSVAVFILYQQQQPIKHMELGILYLGGISTLLLVGPGRVSVDGMMGK